MSDAPDKPLRDVLREVEELDAKATAGPWKVSELARAELSIDSEHRWIASPGWDDEPGSSQERADFALIAASRAYLPRLARELRALARVMPMLDALLGKLASSTSARWDQHLRFEFGDERANELIRVLQGLRELEAK